jgi:hypothetical protein
VVIVRKSSLNVIKNGGKVEDSAVIPIILTRRGMRVDLICPKIWVAKRETACIVKHADVSKA